MSRRLIAFAAAVTLPASTLAGVSAQASPRDHVPTSAGAVPVALVEALHRDLGLTLPGAQRQWAVEERLSLLEHGLADRLGARFAGAWIDGGELAVSVTDEAAADTARAAGARPQVVDRSAAQLDGMMKRLDATRVPSGVSGWHVDVATNMVVVSGQNADAARAFVDAAGVTPDAVRLDLGVEPSRPLADVVGGNAYRIGSGSRCSVGFSVEGGFVTAGHCGKQGASTSGPTGTFRGSSFPGNDYAWVAVSADRPVGAVNDYKGGKVTVAGSTQASTGAQVCRSGSTTGWHCGTISAFNSSVSYPQGTVSGLIKTNVCAEPGDSGGSLLAGQQAQGMTSGGSGDCKRGGTTYFQPVGEALQVYNLRLLTGAGEWFGLSLGFAEMCGRNGAGAVVADASRCSGRCSAL